MPTISWFYGIAIRMYFDDHAPPHFHAVHAGRVALVEIATGKAIRGKLPPTEAWRVRQWTLQHQGELMRNWELAQAGSTNKLPPIAGLDE